MGCGSPLYVRLHEETVSSKIIFLKCKIEINMSLLPSTAATLGKDSQEDVVGEHC